MSRRRIKSLEEADVLMESLGWLKGQGWPNDAVRQLWECAVFYRAAIHRQAEGPQPEQTWQRRMAQ